MRADSAIRTAVGIVVGLLVNGQYDLVEAVTQGDRLSATEIQRAVEQYSRTLVRIPERGWELLEVEAVDGAEPETFDAEIPLFTEEEGRSDLWLSLQLIDRYRGAYDIRLLDISVVTDSVVTDSVVTDPVTDDVIVVSQPEHVVMDRAEFERLAAASTPGLGFHDAQMTAVVVMITELLAAGDYETASRMAEGRRLSAADLERAVRDYGRTLVSIPPAARDSYDVYRVEKADRPTFFVDVDLWTQEEGRSDLTLQLGLIDTGRSTYAVTIDGLHVL